MEKHTILVVDDDPDERLIFTDYFTEISEDFDLQFVNNGQVALQYLQTINEDFQLPGLIVLDLHMPVLNGIETLAQLKSIDRFKDIPVIMFSNADNRLERDECLEKGAYSYFLKPSTLDDAERIAASFVLAMEHH